MNARKILLVVAGVIICLVLLAGLISLTKSPTQLITQKYDAPALFINTVAYKPGTLIFMGTNTIETYNYTTGQATAISPNMSTGGLANSDSLSISSDQKYLIFHNGQVPPGTKLATQLQQAGLDPTLDYWWLYNIANQSFRPQPQDILVAKVDNGRLYTLSRDNNGGVVNGYNIATLEQLSTAHVLAATDFAMAGNKILLQTADGALVSTTDGIVNTQLAAAGGLVGVTPDDQSAIITSTINKTTDLIEISLTDGSTKTIATAISGTPVWLGSGTVLYATGAGVTNPLGQLFTYTASTHKTVSWHIKQGLVPSATSSILLTALLDDRSAVISDSVGNYFLIGTDTLHSVPTGIQ